MSDLSNDTKKHTMKSRETIPLRQKGKHNFNFFVAPAVQGAATDYFDAAPGRFHCNGLNSI
jgi:hypothetical protein